MSDLAELIKRVATELETASQAMYARRITETDPATKVALLSAHYTTGAISRALSKTQESET